MPEKNFEAVGISDVRRSDVFLGVGLRVQPFAAVIGDLDDEKYVRSVFVLLGNLCARVRGWRSVRRTRPANANLASAATHVNSSGGLMHVDVARLPDRPDDGCWAISESSVVGTLDHRDRRRDRAIQHVHRILAVKLEPLPIVNGNTACRIARWIQLESFAAVC